MIHIKRTHHGGIKKRNNSVKISSKTLKNFSLQLPSKFHWIKLQSLDKLCLLHLKYLYLETLLDQAAKSLQNLVSQSIVTSSFCHIKPYGLAEYHLSHGEARRSLNHTSKSISNSQIVFCKVLNFRVAISISYLSWREESKKYSFCKEYRDCAHIFIINQIDICRFYFLSYFWVQNLCVY